jgi:hypothetical protein
MVRYMAQPGTSDEGLKKIMGTTVSTAGLQTDIWTRYLQNKMKVPAFLPQCIPQNAERTCSYQFKLCSDGVNNFFLYIFQFCRSHMCYWIKELCNSSAESFSRFLYITSLFQPLIFSLKCSCLLSPFSFVSRHASHLNLPLRILENSLSPF